MLTEIDLQFKVNKLQGQITSQQEKKPLPHWRSRPSIENSVWLQEMQRLYHTGSF